MSHFQISCPHQPKLPALNLLPSIFKYIHVWSQALPSSTETVCSNGRGKVSICHQHVSHPGIIAQAQFRDALSRLLLLVFLRGITTVFPWDVVTGLPRLFTQIQESCSDSNETMHTYIRHLCCYHSPRTQRRPSVGGNTKGEQRSVQAWRQRTPQVLLRGAWSAAHTRVSKENMADLEDRSIAI